MAIELRMKRNIIEHSLRSSPDRLRWVIPDMNEKVMEGEIRLFRRTYIPGRDECLASKSGSGD
jgi:hypothetical protein